MPQPKPNPVEMVSPARNGHWLVSRADQYAERIDPKTGAVVEVICDGFAYDIYAPDGKTLLGHARTRGLALEQIRTGKFVKAPVPAAQPKPASSEGA